MNKFPYKLTPPKQVVNEAIRYLKIKPTITTVEATFNAIELYVAENIRAVMDIPPYNRALLDGFACRSSDLVYASEESPVVLKVSMNSSKLRPRECVKVNTGDKVPEEADIVVPKEYVMEYGDGIAIGRSFPPGYGIGRRGEDIRKGEVIISVGERLKPWHIALISSQGIKTVKVYKLPKVAVFSTGSEILEPGEPYRDGMVYDSTRRLVLSYLRWMGFPVEDKGLVPDDEVKVYLKFKELLAEYDIVFSTGGTSLGERDYTVKALSKLKPEYMVHGFAIKPGRPGAIAVVEGKLVFALSGFPVAALSELELVFKPLVLKLFNIKLRHPKILAKLTRRIPSQPGIVELYRVRVWRKDMEYYAEPLMLTGSGILSTLIHGNALLVIPEDSTGYDEGDLVEVELISW